MYLLDGGWALGGGGDGMGWRMDVDSVSSNMIKEMCGLACLGNDYHKIFHLTASVLW